MGQRQGVAVRGIGLELLRHRKESDKTLEQVAGQLGVSISTLSRLENGKREPTREDVAAILAVLGVTGAEKDRLIDLARGGIGSSGMVEQSPVSGRRPAYQNFERDATVITNFQPLLVPGLAQTPAYAAP
jgi:transcriptional regulator with XRE-family HTH domain